MTGGELGHLGHQQRQGQGSKVVAGGGLARQALGGPHDQMRCNFLRRSESLGFGGPDHYRPGFGPTWRAHQGKRTSHFAFERTCTPYIT